MGIYLEKPLQIQPGFGVLVPQDDTVSQIIIRAGQEDTILYLLALLWFNQNGGLVWILYIGLQGFPVLRRKQFHGREKVPQDLKRSPLQVHNALDHGAPCLKLFKRHLHLPDLVLQPSCVCLQGVVHILYAHARNGLYLLDGRRQAAVKNHITYIQHGLGSGTAVMVVL